jgi:hypothetical protein
MPAVRIDEETRQRLNEVCRRYGYSKSDAVKRSLDAWLTSLEPTPDACALGADLFDLGSAAEPPADPARRQIWERLHAKYRSG